MIQPVHVVQPVAMIANALQAAVDGTVNEPAAATLAASLSLLPRTIHALWHEYDWNWVGKPAHNFKLPNKVEKLVHAGGGMTCLWEKKMILGSFQERLLPICDMMSYVMASVNMHT